MKIQVRLANESDAEKFLECELNTPGNIFDPAAPLYPSSFTLMTERDGKTIMFLPTQRPFLLESLGIASDADNREIAISLRRMIDQLVEFAKQSGTGELVFICSDKRTSTFAEAHGFEKIENVEYYRLRVKDYK